MKVCAAILCTILSLSLSIGTFAYDDTYNPDIDNIISERGLQNFEKVNQYTNQFTDVPSSAWYVDSVKIAYEYGLVTGTSATTFNPTGNLTIAEAITLAARLNSTYYGTNENFVQTSTWYQVYVNYAIGAGMISTDQFSDYTKTATRAEYVRIMANALPSEALEVINWVEDEAIPDVKSTDSHGAAVYIFYRAGILTGSDEAGTFNPNNSITRAEVSALVTRMADVSLRMGIILTN